MTPLKVRSVVRSSGLVVRENMRCRVSCPARRLVVDAVKKHTQVPVGIGFWLADGIVHLRSPPVHPGRAFGCRGGQNHAPYERRSDRADLLRDEAAEGVPERCPPDRGPSPRGMRWRRWPSVSRCSASFRSNCRRPCCSNMITRRQTRSHVGSRPAARVLPGGLRHHPLGAGDLQLPPRRTLVQRTASRAPTTSSACSSAWGSGSSTPPTSKPAASSSSKAPAHETAQSPGGRRRAVRRGHAGVFPTVRRADYPSRGVSSPAIAGDHAAVPPGETGANPVRGRSRGVAASEPFHRPPHRLPMRGRLERSERGLELRGVRDERVLELVERLVQLSHQRVEEAASLIIVREATPGFGGCPAAS